MSLQSLQVTHTNSYVDFKFMQFRDHTVNLVCHSVQEFRNDIKSGGETNYVGHEKHK
jgi:hypothetical protein